MCKLLNKSVLILIFLVPFFVLACSSTPQKRSAGEVIDDAVISNKIKIKFVKDKVVKAFKINVDTWKGVVTLRGRVDSQEQINRALEIAERQQGVKTVKSYLVLTTTSAKKQKGTSTIEEKDLVTSQKEEKEVSQKEVPNQVVEQPVEQPVEPQIVQPEIDNNLPEVTPQVTAE